MKVESKPFSSGRIPKGRHQIEQLVKLFSHKRSVIILGTSNVVNPVPNILQKISYY